MFKDIHKKITGFFNSWWNKPAETSDISPKEAAEIQKQSISEAAQKLEKSCTPPYVLVAKQLGSEKRQVFEAAVFYLCAIAANEAKYKKAISYILNSYCEENRHRKEQTGFIEEMMLRHKLKAN